jgi:DNA-binding CsgD family transcriptional regulator
MTSMLVERDTEVGVLAGALGEAAHGRGRAVVLDGPAGIGKTSLLTALSDQARDDGVPVLHARGSPLERDFPFGVVRQLFEAALVDEARRAELLSGAAAEARSVLGAIAADSTASSGSSYAALHGLFWLTLNLAGDGPLVVAIDDLHAADRASLRFAGYLARRLADVPVVMAATIRTGEPGTDAGLLAEIAVDPAALRVTPRALTAAGASELIQASLGATPEAAFRDACEDATGGNPLLLSQLLVALAAEEVEPLASSVDAVARIGPRAASQTVLARLAGLPDEAREVARTVAVLGPDAPPATIARIAGRDEADVQRAVRALAGAGIFAPDGRPEFAHAVLRDAVYLDLPADERERRHADAVAVLRELGAPSEQVAAQLVELPPGREPWVAELLRETGAAAAARGAPDSAVGPLRRALAEPLFAADRTAVLVELGRAEMLVDVPAGIEHLEEAYAALDDPVARAQVGFGLAAARAFTGDADRSHETARRVFDETPAELGDLRDALEAIAAFSVYVGGVGGPDALARIAAIARRGEFSDGVGGDMLKLLTASYDMFCAAPAERCLELTRSGLTERVLAADDGSITVVAVITLGVGDQEDALDVADRVRAAALRSGSVIGDTAIQCWRGFAMLRRGELDEAETLVREALAGFPTWAPVSIGPVFCAGWLARVLLERGDVAGAARELAAHDDLSVAAEAARRWRRAHADVLVAQGEFAQALEVTSESSELHAFAENPANDTWRQPMSFALTGLGRTAEAVEVAEKDVALARRWGTPAAMGRTLRVLGTVGGPAEALEEASALLEATPARLEYAKALAAQGSALRRANQARDAREPLRQALELADRCGAKGLAATVRTELKAAGVRPRITALKGPEALTPSERRVAGMAAEGLTNREIAQALFVTPKTIEVHLYNTFRKLEIRSRRELTGMV